jgi:protein phosphatase
MELTIHPPLGYSQQGGRANNEDSIFPAAGEATPEQRWFMVCDGVGGMAWGEIASYLAVDSFNNFFKAHPEPVATPTYIEQALANVQSKFDAHFASHSESRGMATTFTLLYLHSAGATVAHIGDSRVYHLRDGKIIWRTQDHSMVNELLKAGVITPREARVHPQRNVIDRAIQGSEKPVKADVQILNDIQEGDYFFLCTDGVLEQITDEVLASVLSQSISNEEKRQQLIARSTGQTKDNFSAYLVQIETVKGDIPAEYRVPPPAAYIPDDLSEEDDVAVIDVSPSPSPNSGTYTAQSGRPPMPVLPAMPKPTPEPAQSTYATPKPPVQEAAKTPLSQTFLSLVLAVLVGLGIIWFIKKPSLPEKPVGTHKPEEHNAGKPHLKPNQKDKKNKSHDIDDAAGAVGGALGAAEQPTEMDQLSELSDFAEVVPNKLYKQQQEDGGWILVDKVKQPIKNDHVYQDIRMPSEDLIAVQDAAGKWGYIDMKGKEIIKCQFDDADDFSNGSASVIKNDNSYKIDKKGAKLSAKTSKDDLHKAAQAGKPGPMA